MEKQPIKKQLLKKRVEIAFRKHVYLLGCDEYGTNYWLEEPSWDCDWYWGFGYVETYTNNDDPSRARDINTHTHVDTFLFGKRENGEYIHNIYDAPELVATTFDEKTGWELSELFNQFYTLKKAAELFYNGKSNISHSVCTHDLNKCKEIYEFINENMMKAIFSRIIEILTPNIKNYGTQNH